jgi:dTDP-4-dehydrorhamnose 3,5-epimerase
MKFGHFTVETFDVEGPKLISPQVYGDQRGFFTERYRADDFEKMGLPLFIQDNYSRSQCGVIRGLHFQYNGPLGKLVSVTRGQILDVAVDIRASSPTFGRFVQVKLTDAQPQWLWVPAGFAHGFEVLSSEGADILYKVDGLYNPKGEGAIIWNDPELKIQWTNPTPLLSEKDKVAPLFSEYKMKPHFN